MAFIDWTPDYSVDGGTMDEQHKMLFNYVNQYYDALQASDNDNSAKLKALDEVINYTVFHFQDEEKLMESKDFPGIGAHKLIHRQLVEKVIGLRADLAEGKNVANDIKFFLKSWLSAHIKGIDKKYSSYVS
jgi:hemerythrin